MIEKLTPAGAVRAYCQDCLGTKQFNTDMVRDCQGDKDPNGPCAFFPYRLGKRPSVKVFRKFCLDCMIGDREAVACCETENCVCHPYRFGKNPALLGKRKAPKAGIEALRKFQEQRRDDANKRLESTIDDRCDTFPA